MSENQDALSNSLKSKARHMYYDKKILQTLTEHEKWDNFYNILDPSDLWEFIKDIILRHLDIMCPVKYICVCSDSPPWIT